jgi:2-hydroxy-6-oxonona-2,4-dienedioate hydrolase
MPRQEPSLSSLWLDFDGRRMHAIAGGRGAPVVLVHGYGVSGLYMLPLARRLVSSCSLFVPDLPGQGRSDPLRTPTSIRSLADALGWWLDEACLERPIIVANSMGCQVVTDLAARRPGLLGPMVLIGPTIDPTQRRARRQILGLLRESRREPLALVGLAVRESVGGAGQHLVAVARSALADRMEDRLPLIEQQVVIVHGDQDAFLGRDWAEQVATLLPRGRLVAVAGEAHAVHYTRPDLVADIVSELLVQERTRGRREAPPPRRARVPRTRRRGHEGLPHSVTR